MPRKLSFSRVLTVLWPLASVAGGPDALDTGASVFSLAGFGTFAVVHSSENTADFVNIIFEPNGAGYTRSWSASVDSLLAAQVTANLTPRLSAVLQLIAQQNYNDTYWPHVEWANIKFQFTPDISIRIGRNEIPVFLSTDTRKVGYATAWVRPPIEVYSTMVPVTNNDGIDASYRMRIGAASNTIEVNAGRSDVNYSGSNGIAGGTGKARRQLALDDTFEHGSTIIHITYFTARLTAAALDPLFDGFREFGPQGIAVADKYNVNNRLINFFGLGANYDPGKWFAIGEWGHVNRHSILGDLTGWYVGSGIRIATFTPYVTYAQVKAESKTSDPGLTVSSYPPPLAGAAAGLNAALNSILESIPVQNTISVGTRWDFMNNTDAKLQFDHTRLGADSPGTLLNTQPDFRPGGTVNLISASIDFVF